MKIKACAHFKSGYEKIILRDNVWHLYFKKEPRKGLANKKIIEMLADYFEVAKSQIVLMQGEKSPQKVFEIKEDLG